MILAAAHDLRARTGIRRSALTAALVTEVEATTARRLDPAARARAREQGPFVDVLQLAPDVHAVKTVVASGMSRKPGSCAMP